MNRRVNRYTDEEKIAIVNEYYLSGKSKEAISRKYYLKGHSTLSKWIAKFAGTSNLPQMDKQQQQPTPKTIEAHRIAELEKEINLNAHNKTEYPPMHTAEHLLNGTMVKMFGCKRSRNAHIERKKSKCDYPMSEPLSQEDIDKIEKTINEVISQNLVITYEYISAEDAVKIYDLDKLPNDVSEVLRIVHIGDYDACPCVGAHVENTSEIGHFRISSARFQDCVQRIVFRLDNV